MNGSSRPGTALANAPVLISNEGTSAAPKTYSLPPGQTFEPLSITALFDGSGAGGSFLAALSLYSQSGELLARTFPVTALGVGDSATVTYAPFLGGDALDSAGAGATATASYLSSAGTNSTLVKGAGGSLVNYFLSNQGAAVAYLKLYDKATAPTVGSDTPKWRIAIPSLASANLAFDDPLAFDLGIGFGITGGPADNDATAVSSNQVIVNLAYT